MLEQINEQLIAKISKIQSFHVDAKPVRKPRVKSENEHVNRLQSFRKNPLPTEAWRGCFRYFDGTIYLAGKNISTDGGKTVARIEAPKSNKPSILQYLEDTGELGADHGPSLVQGSVFSRPGLFLSLDDSGCGFNSPGNYDFTIWRSTDNLETISKEKATLKVPHGPKRDRNPGEWFGLYICRDIIEMPDGSLLASACGNFEEDKVEPASGPGKVETHYLGRVFVMSSKDQGSTWEYLSTVAATHPEDPVDEGFGEPTMVLLDNGQLLCVMRTGHHRPLYACWSSDQGKTWTEPIYTGLERGCYPRLVKLLDGRLALSYGVRFPAGWSRITPEGDHGRWIWPGAGLVKLAINSNGTGYDWNDITIGSELGTCYTNMFETEPNVLFFQVDGWYWRVTLQPKGN